ncbi:FAD-dependent oxidoreductase [Streptomyces scabiei]|uniref:NAD(P)/FAD-dependent oxidoreductase n=1 Tax=Streptomyces scabiei TaxID=1930 RepID=UPI001B30806A|nr:MULTISPECIES: FAD-dependent oxidoreductase [Streptomyces]MBP5871453.1 FAD-dependent oxidoreductase [Streptomyces sp. LBUM 1485]MBP5912571.1 FAD-dependent oxidoreductase [Streptomyces sp. LBUM 1486]MDX3029359.1 FAD-dependent oxidoreductase [Streptomyces scabiei]MDX3207965.1 FAD-dependent oxidoreductase [Streptomyces scabiei]QTU57975.1 FAD-dependent oxidoreductase [Streptomyces sp. LBUM 1480]
METEPEETRGPQRRSRHERRTAVIGSGVAGLTAAYLLGRNRHVVLYEADDRLGGHAHTHELTSPHDGRVHRVDSGFIVHNRRTYPHLLRLFDELGVTTQESEMTMSVRCEGCGLEYAGARGPSGLFARRGNLVRGRYLRLLAEVPAFHRAARRLLVQGREGTLTLAEFLDREGFSAYFRTHFVTPVVSAVWSCDAGTAQRYPAAYLFRFLEHHGLLSVSGSPVWRTVTGGSRTYVERIAKRLGEIRTGSPVRAVHRHADGADVTTDDGATQSYDAVVIAVHPDQALRLLADPTEREREVLSAFRYSRNTTLLHTDTRLLPRSPGARAAWNYLMPGCEAGADRVRVSYDMNRLQRLDATERFVVTLGGEDRVDPDRVLARMVYEHPVYTPESVAAQRRLPELRTPVCAFAGAYHGWGFHEDGCRSGVEAAAALGARW